MLFDLIFLSLFVTGWLFCAFIPWLAFSVATRGNAGLINLPLVLFAGVVTGLAVPLLGLDGWNGLWISFVAAMVVSALLMTLRRVTSTALDAEGRSNGTPHLPEAHAGQERPHFTGARK